MSVPTDPVAFESSRPHPFRALIQLQPGRPAFAIGLRMAILIAVPLAIGVAIGELAPATLFCMGTLNCSMADVGGARISRWHALCAATVLNALSVGLGTIAGMHVGSAIALMFVVAFACGLANLFGNVASNVGFVVTVLFIVGSGLPGDSSVALERIWLVAGGGATATIVALVIWPIRPYAAASTAVAGCYRSLADLIRALAGNVDGESGSDQTEIARTADMVRSQVNTARSVVTLTRTGRRGSSTMGSALLRLVGDAQRLLHEAEGLAALVRTVPRTSAPNGTGSPLEGTGPAAQSTEPPTGIALDAMAAAVTTLAAAIEHLHVGDAFDAGSGYAPLHTLDGAVADVTTWMMSMHTPETYEQGVAVRPIVDGLEAMTAAIYDASATLTLGGASHDDVLALAPDLSSTDPEPQPGPPAGPPAGTPSESPVGPQPTSWSSETVQTNAANRPPSAVLPSSHPSPSRGRDLLARPLRVWATIRTNLTPDSAIFRHGVRYGTVTAVGVAIAMLFHVDKGYWVPLTAAVVLRPFVADTVQRSLLRVFGTAVGGVMAAAVVAGFHSQAAMIVALFIFSGLAFSFLPLNYGLGVVFLTPTLIVLLSAGSPGDWQLAGHRVIDTLIGAAIGLAGGYLLWPRADRRRFPDDLAAAITADQDQLDNVFDRYLTPARTPRPNSGPSPSLQRAGRAVSNAQVGFQRLLGGLSGHSDQVVPLWSITDASRSVYLEASALENHLDTVSREFVPPHLDEVRSALDQILGELADALSQRRSPRSPQLLMTKLTDAAGVLRHDAEAARSLREAELAGGERRVTDAARQARDLALVSASIDRIVGSLAALQAGIDTLADAS